jgi:hypothetical protein
MLFAYLVMNNFSPAATLHSALQSTAAYGAATFPNTSTTFPTGFILLSTTSVYILGSWAGLQRRTRIRFPTVCTAFPIAFKIKPR